MNRKTIGFLSVALMSSVATAIWAPGADAKTFEIKGGNGGTLKAEIVAKFDRPWAMEFLPDGRMLVTEKGGELYVVSQEGKKTKVSGMWKVSVGGQGGLGDVALHPDFSKNGLVYISYVETTDGRHGSVVVRAKLDLTGASPRLKDVVRIWEQTPKVGGRRHFSQRIAFGPDGKLFISSGDRGTRDRVQTFKTAFGKILRLNDDGSVPADNPWQDKGELARTFWSAGHRNPLGLTFDMQGRLWSNEMGPRHGDELNLVLKGKNYGWPEVSNGKHYSGRDIPDHGTAPQFEAPKAFWVPAISPSSLLIYNGSVFPDWKGDALIGGLSGRALVHVDIEGNKAREANRFDWGKRVREVEQGPDGAVWVLEDGSSGRLLKLTQ